VQTMVTVIPGVYSFEWVGYQGHVIPIVIALNIVTTMPSMTNPAEPSPPLDGRRLLNWSSAAERRRRTSRCSRPVWRNPPL